MSVVGREYFHTAGLSGFALAEDEFDRQFIALEEEVVRIRRHFHAHPEPSGAEVETSAFIERHLHEAGIAARRCRSDTNCEVGVIANVSVGNPSADSPRIAIRCDIDALRIPDEKEVEYCSLHPGVSHACGHDAHSAIALGIGLAAAAFNGNRQTVESAESEFGMRLRLLFQAAEETSAGARWLVDQGAVDGVDAILGLHVDPERPVGEVGIRYGALTANCDEVEILVEGHGGHAARPHHSRDPIAAAVQLVNALYQQLPRSVDSRNPAVFTVGQMNGGYASNVIPERVELRGTLRSIDGVVRERLKQRIVEICDGVAQAARTPITVTFHMPLQSVDNHPRVTAALQCAAERVLGVDAVKQIEQPSMGGEDFSVYLDHVPGAMLRLGCAVPGVEAPFLHSSKFDLDERTLNLGMKILIRAAMLLSIQSTTGEGEED